MLLYVDVNICFVCLNCSYLLDNFSDTINSLQYQRAVEGNEDTITISVPFDAGSSILQSYFKNTISTLILSILFSIYYFGKHCITSLILL